MANDKQNVVVLGASPKADRYSNQAVRLLVEHGHHVIPVHPAVETIEGLAVTRKLTDITDNIDTLTVYVSESVSSLLQNDILQLNPDRVMFNPGAENTSMRKTSEQHGIHTNSYSKTDRPEAIPLYHKALHTTGLLEQWIEIDLPGSTHVHCHG